MTVSSKYVGRNGKLYDYLIMRKDMVKQNKTKQRRNTYRDLKFPKLVL